MVRFIYHACCTPAQRQSSLISKPAVALFLAAGFLIAAMVWFFISLMATKAQLLSSSSLSSISVDPGYSFYLACVTGAAYLISAIFLTIYVRRLAASDIPYFLVTGNPQITGNHQITGNPQITGNLQLIARRTGNQPITITGNSSTAALGHSILPPEYSKPTGVYPGATGAYPNSTTGAYPNGTTGAYPNCATGGYSTGVTYGYILNAPGGNTSNYKLRHNNSSFMHDK